MQIPVRPDDNEDVTANGEKEEARHPGGMFGIDHVSNDLDHIKNQADDGQNDPGHQQARFSLKKSIKNAPLFSIF